MYRIKKRYERTKKLVSVNTRAARDVLLERKRQIEVEGWTADHDREHPDGTLALVAACYAVGVEHLYQVHEGEIVPLWPVNWDFKDKGVRLNLVRAAALLIAEIDRLDGNET